MTPQELQSLVQQDNWRSVLVELIVKNEIDPWNVDVEQLAEAFLKNVRELRGFHVPANVILALSIVLKFKSLQLSLEDEEEEDFPEPSEVDIDDSRLLRRKPRMPITIQDIVEQVEQIIEEIEKKEVERKKKPRQTLPPNKIELNPEDVKKEVEELYTRILSLSKLGRVSYTNLCSEDPEDMARTLLMLLFLSNEDKVELRQERIFEEIEVLPNAPAKEAA